MASQFPALLFFFFLEKNLSPRLLSGEALWVTHVWKGGALAHYVALVHYAKYLDRPDLEAFLPSI